MVSTCKLVCMTADVRLFFVVVVQVFILYSANTITNEVQTASTYVKLRPCYRDSIPIMMSENHLVTSIITPPWSSVFAEPTLPPSGPVVPIP